MYNPRTQKRPGDYNAVPVLGAWIVAFMFKFRQTKLTPKSQIMNIIPWTGCQLIAVLLGLPDYICCAGLGSSCTAATECANVANATCKTTCQCDTAFKTVNQACVLNGINDTCTDDPNRLSANHLTCDTANTQKCQCVQGYKPKAGACIPNAVNDTCKDAADCLSTNHLTCATTKCQCDTGYKPHAGVCIKNVIGKSCTDATVSTVCTLENSVCTSSVCACKPGFKNNADTCLKIIGGHCTGSVACPGDTHSVCKNTLCECAEHFGEKDNVCTATLDSKQCTPPKGTECGANAECDEKTNTCRCSSGFKMSVDTCVAESGGISTKSVYGVFDPFVTDMTFRTFMDMMDRLRCFLLCFILRDNFYSCVP
ncbi:platelet endothelial aggregation receptor 1-like [Ruditapes philippinarum]|uniref:platelet endothelial aggregation receptor 1-like n=1 Tax=Ruditapes philippinarum TaxID=129788 RepID=UPI00295AF389|nr:platelet endothelial aggregation receptor 1-like [Ruditapes philippinarum]